MKIYHRSMRLANAGFILSTLLPAAVLAADSNDEDKTPLAEIVVTGSRLITNGSTAPTPVTVLSAEDLAEKAPSTIPDAIKQLPGFALSSGATATRSSQATPNAAGGVGTNSSGTYLNLRGLGTNRLLVLQDGNRLPANTSHGAVDVNLVPQMLVERVDVVTGGSSAAYGSDAVSGVVNFIIDKRYEGLKGEVQSGMSSRGDMESFRVGLAGGVALVDDRLHLIGSAEHYENDGIELNMDRRWGRSFYGSGGQDPSRFAVAGTAANPLVVYDNVRFRNISLNGVALSGPLAGNQIINGQLVPFDQGVRVLPGFCADCSDNFAVWWPYNTLVPSTETSQFFGRAQFDIDDDLNVWVQASYAKSRTEGLGSNAFFLGNITIFPENAFLPAAASAALGPNPQPFTFGTAFDEVRVPLATNDLTNDALNISAGLEGAFGNGWQWDISFTDSEGNSDYRSLQTEYPKAFASFDAVANPANGEIVCNVTLTNPGLYPGCVPFNVFGRNVMSEAAANYIIGEAIADTATEQQLAEVNLRGRPFSLWAGPVALALGAAYRHEEYELVSNSGTGSFETTGIRGLGSPLRFSLASIEPSSGSRNVKEGYGEVLVPLAKDLPALVFLDLNAAVRVTQYSTSGSVTTWKVGTNWQIVNDVRIRATRSHDIRAPSLFEVFAGEGRRPIPFTDPHIINGESNTVDVVTGGNINLTPERSDAFTAGIVYSPSWADGLTASLDYYRFEIDDAIGSPYTPQQIADICETSNGTSPICGLIDRPLPFSDRTPANTATAIRQVPLNIATLTVEGLDLEVGYSSLLGAGQLDARLLASYLLKYDQLSAPGQPIQEYAGNADLVSGHAGGGGLPELKASLQIRYRVGQWSLSVQERMVGAMDISNLPTSVYLDNRVSAQYYTDLNASYDFQLDAMRLQAFIHASNVFDRQAPLVPPSVGAGGNYPTLPAVYDVVGASFTAGVRVRF